MVCNNTVSSVPAASSPAAYTGFVVHANLVACTLPPTLMRRGVAADQNFFPAWVPVLWFLTG